ncbi:MAG: ABC transporter permease [Firmicutes bacterium]|nr:ABC transporter permease [Bacillota bacterium]
MIPVIIALILTWIVFELLNPHFLTPRNISNLVLQIATIGMLGVGETLILLLGEIDLSIAAVSGLAGGILVSLSVFMGINPVLAIAGAIVAGALIGLFQGFWVTVVGVPSFIVTLAGSIGYQGLLLALLGQEGTVPLSDPVLLAIASDYLPKPVGVILGCVGVAAVVLMGIRSRKARLDRGLSAPSQGSLIGRFILTAVLVGLVVWILNAFMGIPLLGVILIAFVLLFAFITQSTVFGRHIFALGGNREAARRAGINVRWVRMGVFVLASTLGAIGGVLEASRLGAASPASGGSTLLMDSIATAVIGGTSLFGGVGSVYNALAGALVIGSVENGMDLLSAPSSTKFIVEAIVLLAAVTVDALTRRRRRSQ